MTETRTRQALLLSLALALGLNLAGCSTMEDVGLGSVAHWFDSEPTKSKLKGQRLPVLTEDNSLKPDPALAAEPVMLPRPYVNPVWPEAGGYATNAMYHLEASGPLQQIWKQDTGKGSDDDSQLTAPPIIVDGNVYVLDAESHVYAFNAATGAPLWDRRVAPQGKQSFLNEVTLGVIGRDGRIDPTRGFGGGLGSENGRIFVSTGFGDVYALNAKSGAVLWRTHVGIPIVNAPVADGGRVFVSSVDNHLHVLDAANGQQLWEHQGISENASILKSSSVAVSGEYVIVPYTSGELFAIRVSNGHVAWSDTLTKIHSVTALGELDDIAGRPVIDRDMVFAISHSGQFAAINLNTGERAWTKDIGGIMTPWVAGDFVYVLDLNDELICLTRKEGKVKWIHQLPRYEKPEYKEGPIVWAGPVLVSNRLIVTSSNGYAESVSPYTGRLLGRIEIPDGEDIAPVVANQTLYLFTNDAQLVALR